MFIRSDKVQSKRARAIPLVHAGLVMLIGFLMAITTVQAQRQPVDAVIVLDRSTSIGEADLQRLKTAAKNLVDLFNGETDRVGLIAFAGSVLWGERLGRNGFDKKAVKDQIDDITLDYWTASGPALGEAWQELTVNPLPLVNECPRPLRRRRCRSHTCYEPDPDRRRVIVLFTDGAPNMIRADFDFNGCGVFFGSRRGGSIRTDINKCGANLAGSEVYTPTDPGAFPKIDGLMQAVGLVEEGQGYHNDFGYTYESLVYTSSPLSSGSVASACADLRRRLNLSSDPTQPLVPPPPGFIQLPQMDYYNVPLGPVPGVSARAIAVFPVILDPTTNSFRVPGPFGGVAGSRDDIFRHALNGMARNELENMAAVARSDGIADGWDGITMYTIGLDGVESQLRTPNDEWGGETGEQILKRVANVPPNPDLPGSGSDTYNPQQPSGLYVLIDQGRALQAAFARIVGEIIDQ
jgi:hypothetical protein